MDLLVVIIILGIAFLGYWFGPGRAAAQPVLLTPLAPEPDPFPAARLPTVNRRLPQISKSAFAVIKESEPVREHLQYIAESQSVAAAYYSQCLSKFQSARAHVIEQRRHLRKSAAEVQRRTRGASALLAGKKPGRTPVPIDVPKMPPHLTQADYDRKFDAIATGAGSGIGRALGQHNDARLAVIVAVGAAAVSVVTFQKSVRQMAEADGQLRSYLADLARHLDIFRRAYPELVQRSHDIASLEADMAECLNGTTDETWQRYASGACPPHEKELADRLLTHAMHANIYTSIAD